MELESTSNKLLPIHTILPLIILCEGFVSIAMEILAIRQLLPVAGGSVIVTSLIIGIFLLFLALGYRKGGRIVDNLAVRLRFNFLISALWLGIGLSYLFIIFFFNLSEKIVGHYVVYQLMLYLLLIIAPLIYILGQTVPITMNLTRQDKRAGTIGGDALGISTIGSFLGATITALFFMQYMGVAFTIVINVGILLVLVLLLSSNKNQFFFNLAVAFVIFWIIYDLNTSVERNLFVRTNNYANYQILEAPKANLKPGEKMLAINNSFSSYTNNKKEGFPYIEYIKNVVFDEMKLQNKKILVLGAGGFTFSAAGTYNNDITYVDIDNIKKVVEPRFLTNVPDKLIVDDARHYVRSTNEKFDIIIVDAYSNLRSIPSYLLTYQFMKDMQKKLNPNGTIILNIIARPTLSDPYSKRIDNTIRLALKNCVANPLNYADNITNIIYICNHNVHEDDNNIYSDDLNTSTTDAFAWKI